MKNYILTILIVLFSYTSLISREIINLQYGWKFKKGDLPEAYHQNFNDNNWQTVMVPHDWAIAGPVLKDGDGNTGKLPWKDQAWYRLKFQIPKKFIGKTIYILFDGVMAFPQVYLNGRFVGRWDYGYNSFWFDITNFIQEGTNTLAVHVDTRRHDSRWYPGAGIYRKVQLIIVDPVHVAIWGTYVTTPIVKTHSAEVRIQTNIKNNMSRPSNIILKTTIISPQQQSIATISHTINLDANKSKEVEQSLILNQPQRWDIESPVLYTALTQIFYHDSIIDSYSTNFGIRTFRFTADNGFYLNDRRVQLKGVNLHHDHGPLGAAFYPRAMERQLIIMKEMGCNAIRTSHNTAAPELLEMCDRMGLLVFNEAFDKYDAKADITDTTDFENYAFRNIRNFVLRDRNHPSVFLWSVGNEMYDVQMNINNGLQKLHTMINYVRKYDPTRPVTMACDVLNSATTRHFDYYDVHSWNYGRRYRLARQIEPNKSVIISESASTVSTRGYYELPLPQRKTDFTTSLQLSSYDLNAPEWAELPDDDFMWQQDEDYIAGEFVWTGFDYLGEPTPYTNDWVKNHGMTDEKASRSSYFGIVDLVGIPKDRYYLYKSYWNTKENTIHILPHWNWNENKIDSLPVFVYTNGDCAELFLNGKSLGKKCKNPTSDNSIERFRLMWLKVPYIPGEVKAVAYKEGIKIGEKTVTTVGKPEKIKLSADKTTLIANGLDLSYILVEAVDKQNRPSPIADHQVQISFTGPARIAGVGNGNPQSMEPFQSNTIKLFNGKAIIIIASENKTGEIVITVSAKELKSDKIILKAIQ